MSSDTKYAYQKHIAAGSYAFVLLVVGVPVWWKTTEVYRAYIPDSDIAQLDNLPFTQKANILLISMDTEDVNIRGPILQKTLSGSNVFDTHLSVRVLHQSEKKIVEFAKSVEEIDKEIGSKLFRDYPGSIAFMEIPSTMFSETPHIIIGNHRTVYFSSFVPSEDLGAVAVDTILGEPQINLLRRTLSSEALDIRSTPIEHARKRSIGHIDIFLSLLVPQPEYVTASWDIESATKQYLTPFLENFPLNFTVKSQILYLTHLDIPATKVGSDPVVVDLEDLGLAINSVESILASQSSKNPSLNLLVYLPPIDTSPLTIPRSKTNSFLIPRWGGVHIYNFIQEDSENVKFPMKLDVDMEKVVGIWMGQIRSLLGVEEVNNYELMKAPSMGLREWEKDYQLRHRLMENVLDCKSTLSSLSHLLSQISNIVIREDIGEMIEKAVRGVKVSSALVEEGRLVEGFYTSKKALELSETVFFDQSLLALLYFPDDQKYAIYIPFFLPVGIPVIFSLKTIYKFLKEKQ